MRREATPRVHTTIVGGPSSAVLRSVGVLPGGPTQPRGLALNDGATVGLFGTGPVIGGDSLAMVGLASARSRCRS